MEPGQERDPKVPKLNHEKQEQVDLKGNAEIGLHFKHLSLKRRIFENFVSDQQKR